MKLLINAGGRGTRMGHLTDTVPKPMLSLAGKPILAHLLDWAKQSGFTETVILCGYKHEVITDFFGYKNYQGMPLAYSIEDEPLGSGGPILHAARHIDGTFACINGDLVCRVDFSKMRQAHEKSGALITVLLHESTHPHDSDILQADEKNRITRFVSKHDDHHSAGNLGNAGLCIMEPGILGYMTEKKFTFETFLFPRLLEANVHMQAWITGEFIQDIGTEARLREAEKMIQYRNK